MTQLHVGETRRADSALDAAAIAALGARVRVRGALPRPGDDAYSGLHEVGTFCQP